MSDESTTKVQAVVVGICVIAFIVLVSLWVDGCDRKVVVTCPNGVEVEATSGNGAEAAITETALAVICDGEVPE